MGAMVEVPQAGQVAKKMIEYGIEGLGMSRDRWKGMGSVTLQSGEAVYVRDDDPDSKSLDSGFHKKKQNVPDSRVRILLRGVFSRCSDSS